jgi:hypothetical protein
MKADKKDLPEVFHTDYGGFNNVQKGKLGEFWNNSIHPITGARFKPPRGMHNLRSRKLTMPIYGVDE